MLIHKKQKILIAGASGMVGSALVRHLHRSGYANLLTPSHKELNLIEQQEVRGYLTHMRPEVIVIAAAKVGGIYANMTYPADFIYENLMIESHLIHEAHRLGIERLLFLGSSCIYPAAASQPITEEALLTGPLEKTNEAYAIAKIAGVKMCHYYRQQYGRSYISAMPTNLYGPNDNYHPENAHVIPALIRRFHDAKIANLPEVLLWGTGAAKREFLYVDDLASALLLLLEQYDEPSPVNVGSYEEVTIKEAAEFVCEAVSFKGRIINDLSKPDGTMRKKCDISRITQLGWKQCVSLKEGLQKSYADFLERHSALK